MLQCSFDFGQSFQYCLQGVHNLCSCLMLNTDSVITLSLVRVLSISSLNVVFNLEMVDLDFFFFFFFAFMAKPTAYGSSQARGRIGAVDAGLHCSNEGSELHP